MQVNSFIFCKATSRSAEQVLLMLEIFEKASGQQINVNKSSVIFSRNTNVEIKESLLRQLHFQEAGDHSLYLGLPSMIHRKKTVVFGFLKNKLQERIEGWDKQVLSKGGKEIMLKTVAQSLPNYTMSVFLLPIDLCQEIERIMCRFWWRSNQKKNRAIHWLSWENMCKKKSAGGLGFRSIRDFNVALLGKQAWRLLTHPDMLVSKVFKARYFPDGSFINAKIGGNPSYVWRSIMEAQSLMKKGVVRRIGCGENVSVLNDPWLPDCADPYVHTSSDSLHNATVSTLMSMTENQWDHDLVKDIFEERDANLILSIPVNKADNDTWYWKFEKLGNYTVKSAYGCICDEKESNQNDDNSGFWRQLWNLKIPPKVKHFAWRAITGTLPTKDNLRRKRVDINICCPVCQNEVETILHILVDCTFADACWEASGLQRAVNTGHSFREWLQVIFKQYRKEETQKAIMLCWMLWKSRNDLVWNQHSLEVFEVVESAKTVLNQWRSVQDKTFDHFLGYMSQDDGHEHWQLPRDDRVKINSDAAVFEHENCYSHAFVVRNNNGQLLEARSKCLQGRIAPELAEAIGVREVLGWIKDTGYHNVDVETDCLQVVQAIRSSITRLSYLGRVIEECRVLLEGLKDQNVLFRFVKRSANRVSHYLARYSCSISDRVWRVGDVHSEFQNVLLNDLKN